MIPTPRLLDRAKSWVLPRPWANLNTGMMNGLQYTRRNWRIGLLTLATLAAILPTTLCAQAPGKRLMTPQDLWAMKRLSSPELSPDGRTAQSSTNARRFSDLRVAQAFPAFIR